MNLSFVEDIIFPKAFNSIKFLWLVLSREERFCCFIDKRLYRTNINGKRKDLSKKIGAESSAPKHFKKRFLLPTGREISLSDMVVNRCGEHERCQAFKIAAADVFVSVHKAAA